jgi:hypothetical protein
MQRVRHYIYSILAILIFSILLSTTASAQLVLVNLKCKIVSVERENNRLQVRVHEGGNRDVQYIEIDKNTSFSHNNRDISYYEAWRSFRKGMIIRVKGGYTVAVHVKAKQIWW